MIKFIANANLCNVLKLKYNSGKDIHIESQDAKWFFIISSYIMKPGSDQPMPSSSAHAAAELSHCFARTSAKYPPSF
jgi:hypothetical protein